MGHNCFSCQGPSTAGELAPLRRKLAPTAAWPPDVQTPICVLAALRPGTMGPQHPFHLILCNLSTYQSHEAVLCVGMGNGNNDFQGRHGVAMGAGVPIHKCGATTARNALHRRWCMNELNDMIWVPINSVFQHYGYVTHHY